MDRAIIILRICRGTPSRVPLSTDQRTHLRKLLEDRERTIGRTVSVQTENLFPVGRDQVDRKVLPLPLAVCPTQNLIKEGKSQ